MAESSKAVFLSYASEDAPAAARLCAALRAAGIEVWFDQSELRGGDAWDNAIRKQIKACTLFVPLISVNTHARVEGYFRLEWKLAIDRSHSIAPDRTFLLPVVIDRTPQEDDRVPDRFRDLQWTRLPAGEATPAFIQRVLQLLAPEQSPGSSQSRTAVGVRPSSSDKPQSPSALPRSVRAGLLLAAIVVIAVGFFARNRLLPPRRAADTVPVPAQTAHSGSPAPPAATDKSIAVLAFTDMSEKHDQEYFSDGLSEELINRLAQNAGLKVIARTSSFQFKTKSEDVRSIAGKLGVANILEGSVRKSGDKLRITAQLIRASDGVHLWSNTYDRKLDDVFKVQEQIAGTVAQALRVSLLGDAPQRITRTPNLEAYNLYLQALAMHRRANEVSEFVTEIDYLHRALKADPTYAPAWALLSIRLGGAQADDGMGSVHELNAEARRAAERALELDPMLSDGHTAMGRLLVEVDWDFAGAERQFREALKLDPNDSRAQGWLGTLAAWKGDQETGVHMMNESIRTDPANPLRYQDLSLILYLARKYSEALDAHAHMLDLNPGAHRNHLFVAWIHVAMGEPAAALTELDRDPDRSTQFQDGCRAMAYDALGRKQEADAALASMEKAGADSNAYLIALVYASRNDLNRAFQWLDRAYLDHNPTLTTVKVDPLLRNVQSDPRFKALLVKLKLSGN
ncbi:MAG TPA: TIR domain-containing protein [Steroidobacteraceae bacterium]